MAYSRTLPVARAAFGAEARAWCIVERRVVLSPHVCLCLRCTSSSATLKPSVPQSCRHSAPSTPRQERWPPRFKTPVHAQSTTKDEGRARTLHHLDSRRLNQLAGAVYKASMKQGRLRVVSPPPSVMVLDLNSSSSGTREERWPHVRNRLEQQGRVLVQLLGLAVR